MIQYFAKTNFKSLFDENNMPTLLFISKIDKQNSTLPRIMHSHDDMLEILFIRSGSGEYIIDNIRYPIEKGDIIICNSNSLHADVPASNNNLSFYCCAISNVQMEHLPKNHLINDNMYPIFKSDDNYSMIKNIMKLLYLQVSSNNMSLAESSHNLMLSLILTTYNLTSKSTLLIDKNDSNQCQLCSEIKEYINLNFKEDITLNTISDAMHISPFYLSHIFKNCIGFSPMQYLLRRRLGDAQTLLIHSILSITEIGSKVGYGNPNYFNIIFSKKVGMSPSHYRKAYISNSTFPPQISK